MHMQTPVNGWLDAVNELPEGGFVKGLGVNILRDAKQRWTSLGRDPSKLIADYRHFNYIYPFDRLYSFDELKALWRVNFDRWVSGDLSFLDLAEELNEYFDERMVTDKVLLQPYLASAQAAVAVWNSEYRGKRVPDHCRLVIGNSPVGNSIPREFMQLAVDSDSVLGYHPYTKWHFKTRDPQDWRFHSGRWLFNEQEYGLKPLWAFTECGPYLGADEGWRHKDCLDNDLPLLVVAMKLWVTDLRGTAAYREGRILGTSAWFTSIVGEQWKFYQYDRAALVAVAQMMKHEWRQEWIMPFDPTTIAKVHELTRQIDELVDPTSHVWKVGDIALANTNPLITYTAPNGPVKDKRPPTPPGGPMVTYDLNVLEVTADQLWLRVAAGLWVKAADVKLKGS